MKVNEIKEWIMFIAVLAVAAILIYNFINKDEPGLQEQEILNRIEEIQLSADSLVVQIDALKDSVAKREVNKQIIEKHFYETIKEIEQIESDTAMVRDIRRRLRELGTANFNTRW